MFRPMYLHSIVVTPVSAEGRPLRNPTAVSRIANRAVELTGVIAAVWTRTAVELLIGSNEEWHAESVAELASLAVDARCTITTGHASLMRDLIVHVSALTGLAMPDVRASDIAPTGMLFNHWVTFDADGLNADSLNDALTVISK